MKNCEYRFFQRPDDAIIRGYDGRAFGFASRNFYVAFLAAAEAEQNAEQYFGPVRLMQPREELVVRTTDFVPAEALAEAFGLSVATLRDSNPALLDPVTLSALNLVSVARDTPTNYHFPAPSPN